MRIFAMHYTISIVCLSFLAAMPAVAQIKSSNAPIEVSADSFLADTNTKSGIYSGNVQVKQGDVTLHANTVRVNLVGSKPDKIIANGKVVVNSPSATLSGDMGVYDVGPRLITLTGNVVLSKGKDRQTANKMTYNVATGIATFGGGVSGSSGQGGASGGRVRGEFTPPPQSKSGATP
jgi:lipopolysaccharide export system protein LptA